jgi:hypothetical protein
MCKRTSGQNVRKKARDLTLDELKLELNYLMEPYAPNSTRVQLIDLLNIAKDPRRKRATDLSRNTSKLTRSPTSGAGISDEFIEYYRDQLCLNEEEMDLLFQYLATPLPISFRLNLRCSPLSADEFDSRLRAILFSCSKTEGTQLTRLLWYPGGAAWELRAGRRALRSTLQPMQAFLVEEAATGTISRQEAVTLPYFSSYVIRPQSHTTLARVAKESWRRRGR